LAGYAGPTAARAVRVNTNRMRVGARFVFTRTVSGRAARSAARRLDHDCQRCSTSCPP